MRFILPFIFSFSFFQTSAQSAPDYCSYTQQQFNSDSCCWRALQKDGFYIEAAQMITSYLAYNHIHHNRSFSWHQGQLYALAGNYDLAKRYIHRSFSVLDLWFGGKDGKAWFWYAKGTLAYLNHKEKDLKKIIIKWESKFPKDNNYQTLVNLRNNFDSGYSILLR